MLDTIVDVFDVSMNWLRTGQGEMRLSPAPAQRDPAGEVTLRDILRLHEEIHKLASEIGDIKIRMLDAAQTGDINRLGLVGGKGK